MPARPQENSIAQRKKRKNAWIAPTITAEPPAMRILVRNKPSPTASLLVGGGALSSR
jgi:hypothetical protein